MDINFSTLGTMFTGTAGSNLARSEPAIATDTSQQYSIPMDNVHSFDNPQTEKTYNNCTDYPEEPTNTSSENFDHALHDETISISRPGDTDEIGHERSRRRHEEAGESKTQSSSPEDVPTLNLLPFVASRGLVNIPAALGARIRIRARNPGLQQVGGKNPCKAAQSARNHSLTGLKPIFAGLSGGVTVSQNEKQTAKSAGKVPEPPDHRPGMSKFPVQNSKSVGQASRKTQEVATADPTAASTSKKTPLSDDGLASLQEKPLDAKQKPILAPEKPSLAAEKLSDSNVANSKGLPESLSAKSQTDNPFGSLAHRVPDPGESQGCSSQSKNPGGSGSNSSFVANFEQVLSIDNGQMAISEQSSATAQAARATNTTSPGDVTAGISQQIMESVQGSLSQGDKHITIYLNPPELGKVVVRFQEQQDQVSGLLEVSKAETRYEIEQALPQIMRSLQDLGVQVRRLEVQLSEQMERQANRDSSLDDGPLHQQGSGEGGNPDNKSAHEWLPSTFRQAYWDDLEPQLVSSDQSINMLV